MVEKTGIPWKITSSPDDRVTSNTVHDGKMLASLAIEGDLNSVVLIKMILYPERYKLSQEEREKNISKGYKQISQNEWGKIETTEKLQDFVDHKPSNKPELPASPGANLSNTSDSDESMSRF